MKNITFNEEVRSEICSLDFDENSSYYILLGLFINAVELKLCNQKQSYVIATQYPQLIRLMNKLLKNINSKFNSNIYIDEKNNINNKKIIKLEIIDQDNQFEKIFNLTKFDINILDDENKQKSFILGAYLAGGSISFSTKKSSYHFEIKSHKMNFLLDLKTLLKKFNIETKIISYKNKFILYFKKGEYISDLLKLFNVVNSLYKFEDFRIKKDFSNSLQRLNNLEVSNINKTILASSKQQQWIAKIEKTKYFNQLTKNEKIFCKIRLEHSEYSLSTISKIMKNEYNINISRSAINHYIKKIKNIYNKI